MSHTKTGPGRPPIGMGIEGPMPRILVESLDKLFVQAFSSLCHRFKHGLDIRFACIFVMAPELTLATLCGVILRVP